MTKYLLPFVIASMTSVSVVAEDKVTYDDHIRPMLENACFSCHNPDKKKGDLDLTNFGALMVGGGGGSVVDPGNPDGSRLWTTTSKKEEPFMPPEGSPLNQTELDLMAAWINGGVLETKSSLAKKSTQPKVDLAVNVSSGKPEGPVAMPEHVLLEPVVVTPRTTAITAMAASPWGPLLAIAGQKQILLYDTDTQSLAGVLPYEEGFAESLQFSQNGSLLVMGGGRGGKFGHAVVWDVTTGKRMTEVGGEFDSVMSADISPDHRMVVIGSPSKKVKCFSTATGEELYTLSKHTEWVMETQFSPDGILLATADRNGNVIVWEASNGGEFYQLGQHKESCTDIAWRADSNVVASCSLDGMISAWEMTAGKEVKTWEAHKGGVLSIAFTPDGKVVSSGNDGIVRVWDLTGKKLGEGKSQGDLVTEVVALHDGKTVVTGNWRGEVQGWNTGDFAARGTYSSNPPLIAQRIVEAEQMAGQLQGQIAAAQKEVPVVASAVKAEQDKLAALQKKLADTTAQKQKAEADLKALPAKVQAQEKVINDMQAKRSGVAKQHEERNTKLGQLKIEEVALAAAKKERATLTAPEVKLQATKLDQVIVAHEGKVTELKKATATAPADLAVLDAELKKANDAKTALQNSKASHEKVVADSAKLLEAIPPQVTALEKVVADTAAKLASLNAGIKDSTVKLGFYQKLPTNLRAAQFNVGVLTEKEALAKLEGELEAYKAAIVENESALEEAKQRIDASKKKVAEIVPIMPQKEALVAKLKAEYDAHNAAMEPSRKAEAGAVITHADAKSKLDSKEAERVAVVKKRDDALAASKAEIDGVAKSVSDLKKKIAEVEGKLAGPRKVVDTKRAELAKGEATLKAAQENAAAAKAKQDASTKVLADSTAVAKSVVSELAASEAALKASRENAAEVARRVAVESEAVKKAEAAAAKAKAGGKPDEVVITEKALAVAKGKAASAVKAAGPVNGKTQAMEASVTGFAKKMQEVDKALAAKKTEQAALSSQAAAAAAKVAELVKSVGGAKTAVAVAEKAAAPLEGQHASIRREIDAKQKALVEKQAEQTKLSEQFAAQLKPFDEALVPLKAAATAAEKALAAAKTAKDAEQKVLDAKAAEVSTALAEVDALKKEKAEAEAGLAAATKAVPEREASIAGLKKEQSVLQPQLDPLRAKVKALEEQYFGMLPK